MEEKFTLITGASNGIGKEMAIKCASMKMNVLLVSLPNENLEELSKKINAEFGVYTDYFECNLTHLDTPENIFNWTQEKGYKVNFLINNAGFGGVGPFENYDFAYINRMLDLNIRATTLLTHYFIPELKKNTPSYVINTSSMAANFPFPYKSMYASTKAYVKNFTRALREELSEHGIKVCLLQPGATPTNSIVKTQIETGGYFARISVTDPKDVASYAIERVLNDKPIAIPGFKNRVSLIAIRLFPMSILQKLLAKQGRSMRDN